MKQTLNVSRRLKLIASHLPTGAHFADIGSDHAYLPCFACLNDSTVNAIAGEVNTGPYASAQQTVSRLNLESKIEVRQGNGLDVLAPEEVNTIVIAGMGGTLISDILKSGEDKLTNIDSLILQPNNDVSLVRTTLAALNFKIKDEDIIKEQGHFYEVIVAGQACSPIHLDVKEQLFGPVLKYKHSETFCEKWERESVKLHRAIAQMQNAKQNKDDKINIFEEKLNWIEEVLANDSNR